MSAGYLVDTSVWSLAFRRDAPPEVLPHVMALRNILGDGADVYTTGMIELELLRGAIPDRARAVLKEALSALAYLEPRRDDYEAAAVLATTCRNHGVQLATVDALIAQLAISYRLTLLTTDEDFSHAARHVPLVVWTE